MIIAVNKWKNLYLVVKYTQTFAYELEQGSQILRAGCSNKDIWVPTPDNFQMRS